MPARLESLREALEVLDAAHKATTQTTTAGGLSRARVRVGYARAVVVGEWVKLYPQVPHEARAFAESSIGIDVIRLVVNPKKWNGGQISA